MEPRLSMVATFDDLRRNNRIFTAGDESVFLTFVRNQEECRKLWLASEEMINELQSKIRRLETTNRGLETTNKELRYVVDHEMQKRHKADEEKELMERQVGIIRELLNDKNSKSVLDDHDRERLAMLSNTLQRPYMENTPKRYPYNDSSASLLSPDVSCDKTEEDLDISPLRSGRKWKRPTAPPLEEEEERFMPPKRQRSNDHDNSIITTTTITVAANGCPVAATTEVSVPKMNKSFSEPALEKYTNGYNHGGGADSDPESDESFFTPNKKRYGLRRAPSEPETPNMRKASSTGRGLNRVHIFFSRTVIKPENCVACNKRIKFGKLGVKCKDCRSMCHPECKDQLPLPCVPTASSTPRTTKHASGGLISDHTPCEPPMIPGIVIHCVNEVEARGLNEVGIYRVPGADRQVKDLKEKFFKGKGMPNLSKIDDIHVICGCLKDFLRDLKEPLITYRLWKKFVEASEFSQKERTQGTYRAIDQLPQPNRDTIAFMILHLQRVADCAECKMPASNLAKVFGPTLVGYSCPEPEPLQMINETRCQAMVMEALLSLPMDYWVTYINVSSENTYPIEVQTPEARPVPHSMLGPISTPGSVKFSRNANTPRFGTKSKGISKRPAHFFSSPIVK